MKWVKQFTIERPGREPETQRWAFIDEMRCPRCGQTDVWHPETDPGDYYVGETHICGACGNHFTIQQRGVIPEGDWYAPILAKLRT
jgi:transcription elongation factor Elf1